MFVHRPLRLSKSSVHTTIEMVTSQPVIELYAQRKFGYRLGRPRMTHPLAHSVHRVVSGNAANAMSIVRFVTDDAVDIASNNCQCMYVRRGGLIWKVEPGVKTSAG